MCMPLRLETGPILEYRQKAVMSLPTGGSCPAAWLELLSVRLPGPWGL